MGDISRAEAQKRAVAWFGKEAFARKKTKTQPGVRRQVVLRSLGPGRRIRKVIGAGRTWAEAFAYAAVNTGLDLSTVPGAPVVIEKQRDSVTESASGTVVL